MWSGEGEVGAATLGGFLGKQEGNKMADEPGNLKGKELEAEKGGKIREEQGRREGIWGKEEEGGGG